MALSDKLTYGAWEMRVGLRHSYMQFDRTTSPQKPQTREAQINHTSAALGLGYRLNDTQRLWLSNTQSFLPNRGQLRSGGYLPPSEGQQTEAGWEYRNGKQSYLASYFVIKQSNFPAPDPLDKDASILIGTNRSRGFELNAAF